MTSNHQIFIHISHSMEIRRAADALLRSHVSPLTSFLTPSLASRCQSTYQLASRSASNNSVARTFTSSSRSLAPRSSVTTSTEPAEKTGDDVLEKSKSLWTSPDRTDRGNSSLLNHVNSSLRPNRWAGRGTDAFADMLDINANSKNPSTLDMMQAASRAASSVPPQQAKIPMRLTPSTGRTVMIGAGVDVGRGFRLMEQACARNKIRSDFTRQRFHERGGLKRKRLRRERWRKRFMTGFKAAIGRVKELKRQGW